MVPTSPMLSTYTTQNKTLYPILQIVKVPTKDLQNQALSFLDQNKIRSLIRRASQVLVPPPALLPSIACDVARTTTPCSHAPLTSNTEGPCAARHQS